MSPRVMKRPVVSVGTVRMGGPVSPPLKDPRRLEQERKEKALLREEIRAEFLRESEEKLAKETQKMRQEFQTKVAHEVALLEPDIVRLVLAVAGRVCRQELTVSHEGVLAWVREGLTVMGAGNAHTIRVAPDAVDSVSRMERPAEVHVQGDPSLSSGDVVLDGDRAQWDARLSTRLEETERAFVRLSELPA